MMRKQLTLSYTCVFNILPADWPGPFVTRFYRAGYPVLTNSHPVRIDFFFFFSSRRRHTRFDCDWSSDVCSSDLQDSTHMTAQIPASDIATVAAASVAVFNPVPGGGTSSAIPFAIIATVGGFKIGRASCRGRV